MDIKYFRQRKEATHSLSQLPKKINSYPVTQTQIGDSQPFSPLELIAMYPEKDAVPRKLQQTGDNLAEKERNTATMVFRRDDSSIRVNDLIYLYW